MTEIIPRGFHDCVIKLDALLSLYKTSSNSHKVFLKRSKTMKENIRVGVFELIALFSRLFYQHHQKESNKLFISFQALLAKRALAKCFWERKAQHQAQHFCFLLCCFMRQQNDAHLYKTEIRKPAVHSLCGIKGDISVGKQKKVC